ncbi:MAG: glycoside hydrolase family 43 protein [Candidatus Cyclobacteriaceae bacterium M2_1C_046]
MLKNLNLSILMSFAVLISACDTGQNTTGEANTDTLPEDDTVKAELKPIIDHMYTADPSAHVFEGKIYLYPSHDYESGIPEDDLGSHFHMKDYHVFSMDSVGGEITDHGVALKVEDVPWAEKQMWAPDAAEKNGKYYFYFPAKDKDGIFRLGVAVADNPAGPFTPEEKPIEGSYSIDPAVYKDEDGTYYMYFGGIWGGQLQRWTSGEYKAEDTYPAEGQPALNSKVVKLSDDMKSFAEQPRDVVLLDQDGSPIKVEDNEKRFFEAAWVHKYNGKYYFSYSTGDTHNIAYATGDSPYGPFTYQGIILKPVLGWTNHHSIVEHDGKWWLFFHDSSLSGGKTHLRSVKVTELKHKEDGTIETIDAMVKL